MNGLHVGQYRGFVKVRRLIPHALEMRIRNLATTPDFRCPAVKSV